MLPYLGNMITLPGDPVTLLRYPSYPTFTDKVICRLRGKLSHYRGALKCSYGCFVWYEADH